ncbi:MAG TPA: DUF5642 family protein [Mycobacterium sp.]
MTQLRRTIPFLAAFGVGVTLAGCGHSTEHEATSSTAAQSSSENSGTSAAPAAALDISRVDNVKDDFPAGFSTEAEPAKSLTQQDIDNSGVNSFTDAEINPPQCRPMIIPPGAQPTVGAQAAGVRAKSDQGNMFVVAITQPQPVQPGPPPTGCDKVTVAGGSDESGTAETIPAPQIDGATTTGVKLTMGDDEDPDYIYTAALDNQTSVIAVGSAAEDVNPQQTLSDLLVKAAAAVRGQ